MYGKPFAWFASARASAVRTGLLVHCHDRALFTLLLEFEDHPLLLANLLDHAHFSLSWRRERPVPAYTYTISSDYRITCRPSNRNGAATQRPLLLAEATATPEEHRMFKFAMLDEAEWHLALRGATYWHARISAHTGAVLAD